MSRTHSTKPPVSHQRRPRRPRVVDGSARSIGTGVGGAAGRTGKRGATHGTTGGAKRVTTRVTSPATPTTGDLLEMILAEHVTPALKGWLLWDGEFVMGPRYIRLLEGIERHGSIRAACGDLGLSYRTCLTRIRRMERVTGAAIVITQRGGAARGGAEVTPLGRRLVRAYRAWRDELERASRRAFTRAIRD